MAERFRDLVRPSLVDVGARSTPSGASQASEAIAESLRSFSRTATEWGGALASNIGAREGEKQGREEGLTGTPEFREGFKALSAFGQAYNSASETSYAAQLQTDIDETLTQIEQESEADLEGFNIRTQEYARNLLEEVPDEMRPVAEHILGARTGAGANRIRSQIQAKSRSQAHADYIKSTGSVINNAAAAIAQAEPGEAEQLTQEVIEDNEARLAVLIEDNVIDPVKGVELSVQFRESLTEGLRNYRLQEPLQELVSLAREDVEMGDLALAALEERDDLSFEDKEFIRTEYRKQRELLTSERSRQFFEESGALAASLAAGASGGDVVEANRSLYRSGAISVDEYESNLAKIVTNSQKNDNDAVDMAAIEEAMAGGRGLDPTNNKQRAALDKLFKSMVSVSEMEPGSARWQELATTIARRTNMLPPSAQSWARVSMLSGQPEQVALGASFFARARDANPAAWDYDTDPKIAAFAEQVNNNLSAGVPIERAEEIARNNVYELQPHMRDALQQQYREADIAEDNIGELRSFVGDDDERFNPPGLFRGTPEVPVQMRADYDRMVREMFLFTNGDVDVSRKLAYDAIQSRYGLTEMNGEPEIMKFAPETMYPGMTPDVIRNDVAESLKQMGYEGDPAAVRLTPIPDTERTKGRIWMLQTVDEFGGLDVVRGPDNLPVRYQLPLGADFEAARQRIQEEREADLLRQQQTMREHEQQAEQLRQRAAEAFKQQPAMRGR